MNYDFFSLYVMTASAYADHELYGHNDSTLLAR